MSPISVLALAILARLVQRWELLRITGILAFFERSISVTFKCGVEFLPKCRDTNLGAAMSLLDDFSS